MNDFLDAHLAELLAFAAAVYTGWIAYKQHKSEQQVKRAEREAQKKDSDREASIEHNTMQAVANEKIIDQLQEEVSRLRSSMEARDRNEQLNYIEVSRIRSLVFKLQEDMLVFKVGVQILSDQIRALGHDPAWMPPMPESLAKTSEVPNITPPQGEAE